MQEFGRNIMSDPYKVLGISRDATDDEVKKAYREKSRKYHPDANVNNPNKDKAEEMFKLVQQAYDQIMNERKNKSAYSGHSNSSGTSGGYYSGSGYGGYNEYNPFGEDGPFGGFGGFGGFGNQYGNTNQKDSHYVAAANYINSGHFNEALNVLNSIQDRTAEWYFLSAVANNGVGNNVLALDLARTALQMEPNNTTYQRLVQTLQSGGNWYSDRQSMFGGDSGSMTCCADPCTTLCLLNLCCHC